MSILVNPRHERFAGLIAKGAETGRAYEDAGFEARGKSANESGCRLLKDPEVAARVDELKAEAAADCRMSKNELMGYLVDVLKTPAGEVADDHKLCQAYKHTDTERSIKMPDKLRAAELLSKMCGWNEPEKVTHEAGDTLSLLLKELRAGG